MARRSRNDPTILALMCLGVLTLAVWFAEQPMWLRAVLVVSAILTVGGWWALLRMPTHCRVANRSNQRGCTNNARGLLGACWIADHRARKWKLILRKLLGRSTPAGPPASVHTTGRAATAGASAPGAEYRVEAAGFPITMLACTLVTTACTMLTTGITVIQLAASVG